MFGLVCVDVVVFVVVEVELCCCYDENVEYVARSKRSNVRVVDLIDFDVVKYVSIIDIFVWEIIKFLLNDVDVFLFIYE